MENEFNLFRVDFSDIYVRVDAAAINEGAGVKSFYKPKKKHGISGHPTLTLPDNTQDEVFSLRKKISSLYKADVEKNAQGKLRDEEVGTFSLTFLGRRMRVCTLDTVSPLVRSGASHEDEIEGNGQLWACVRLLNSECPTLETIKLPPIEKIVLRDLYKRTGLILISGPTGAGKSTTGLALMNNNMEVGEGTGLMLEDPCEFIMQGEFKAGRSVVFQNEVRSQEGWVDGARRALRFAPDYCYIGELRDPHAVAQVLRLAATGHQVAATIHAGSVEQAISSVIHITRSILGDLATQLIADCLTAVFNQRFENGSVAMTSLLVSDEMSDPVRSAIRSGSLQTLKDAIEKQSAKRGAAAASQGAMSASPRSSLSGGPSQAPRPAPKRSAPPPPAQKGGMFGFLK